MSEHPHITTLEEAQKLVDTYTNPTNRELANGLVFYGYIHPKKIDEWEARLSQRPNITTLEQAQELVVTERTNMKTKINKKNELLKKQEFKVLMAKSVATFFGMSAVVTYPVIILSGIKWAFSSLLYGRRPNQLNSVQSNSWFIQAFHDLVNDSHQATTSVSKQIGMGKMLGKVLAVLIFNAPIVGLLAQKMILGKFIGVYQPRDGWWETSANT